MFNFALQYVWKFSSPWTSMCQRCWCSPTQHTTPVQLPRQWKRLYLIFPALKQESISIALPLQLSKLNFSTFLVPKYASMTSTGPPWHWKLLYLIFPALKYESTSIVQPLQLWNLNFSTLLVSKHACTTSTGPPRQWKRHYLSFPAPKQESTSIA